MSRVVRLVLLLPAFLAVICCPAQNVTATGASTPRPSVIAERDAAGVAQIERSLTALGGESLIASLQDGVISGQGLTIGEPTKPYQITLKLRFADIRREVQTDDGMQMSVVSGTKGQFTDATGKTSTMPSRSAVTLFPIEVPAVELHQLLGDKSRSVLAIADPNPNIVHIRVAFALNLASLALTKQDWYFDKATSLPLRVDFVMPDMRDAMLDGIGSVHFVDWQVMNGVTMPNHIESYIDGKLDSTIALQSATFNNSLPISEFQIQ